MRKGKEGKRDEWDTEEERERLSRKIARAPAPS